MGYRGLLLAVGLAVTSAALAQGQTLNNVNVRVAAGILRLRDFTDLGRRAAGAPVRVAVTIPSYQKGTPGLASTTYRNVPDISYPSYYTDTYVSGGWVGLEGTSWSSPTYVGLQLEINQIHSERFGLVNASIYPVSESNFHDIAHGSNGEYSAKKGYDNVTGRGSPRGWELANSL